MLTKYTSSCCHNNENIQELGVAMKIRQPAVSGHFYPSDPTELSQQIEQLLSQNTMKMPQFPKAIISPHAGLVYSGSLAAKLYSSIWQFRHKIKRVVLIGPAHKEKFDGIAISGADQFKTPLGTVPIDSHARDFLVEQKLVTVNDAAHLNEHCLEMQLLFLQKCVSNYKIVPIITGNTSPERVAALLNCIWGGEETLVVISSDLSHHLSYDEATKVDQKTKKAIEDCNPAAIQLQNACGRVGIQGLLIAAKSLNLQPKTIDVVNSGDTVGAKDRVVGYGAWSFFENGQIANIRNKLHFEKALLEIAGGSLRSGIENGRRFNPVHMKYNPCIDYVGGTFVTLTLDNVLRGCIGTLKPYTTLKQDVSINTFRAAFEDKRFAPMTSQEIENVTISISTLSTPEKLSFSNENDLLNQLVPGKDGVILKDGESQGTFLPSMWKSLPDKKAFLEHLKEKAHLPRGYWSPTMEALRYSVHSFSGHYRDLVKNKAA